MKSPQKTLQLSLNEMKERRALPTRQDEQWKYTSVATLAEAHWVSASKVSAKDAEAAFMAGRLSTAASAEIVFVNGHYIPELSSASSIKGLFVGPLANADKSVLKSSEKTLKSEAHVGKESAFSEINASTFADAVVVHLSAGVSVKNPILLNFIHTSEKNSTKNSDLPVSQPHVIAIFDRMSEASIIENHVCADDARYLSNGVTDGILNDGARITYVKLQRESSSGNHIGTTRFTLSRDAKLESLQISLGAKLSRQDLKISLTAPNAEAIVDGLYIENGKQHVDNHTSIEHLVGDTQSEQLYKGILDGESRAVFNGRIYIAQDAQRANSSQLNNNLLLSKKAEVDTKPELEIFADDVKAGHGATIGRLDPEHLFYLRSRAISETEAVGMLAYGFANELVLRRTNEFVRQALLAPVKEAVSRLRVHV